MSDPDNPLRERLRSKLEQKADGDESGIESEENHGDEMDDEDDDEDDMESMADMPEGVEEAAQMVAESAPDDVEPGQVMEMISPLFGEDTRDDPQELAGEELNVDEVVTEEDLEAKLDDLRETVDSKLEGVVDELADETRAVVQEANVGRTPSANHVSGSGGSELYSDGGENGGSN